MGKKHDNIVIRADDLMELLAERPDIIAAHRMRPSGRTVWLVTWPEHVVNPRYDSDASYGRVGRAMSDAGWKKDDFGRVVRR